MNHIKTHKDMKHTKLLIAAMAIPALAFVATGCAEEEYTEPQNTDTSRAIRFSAETQPIGRAGDYTATSLDTFIVYAYQPEVTAPYMNRVTVARGNKSVWSYSPEKYWPQTSLSFYAYAPASWVPESGPLSPVHYDNVLGQQDLIYSVKPDQQAPQAGSNAQVNFRFSHAVSKVTVNLASTDSRIRVEASNLTIHGLYTQGDFTFPTAANTTEQGTWSNLSDQRYYTLFTEAAANKDYVLTTVLTEPDSTGTAPTYYLPQTLSAADVSYIELTASIYDVETGAKIWPNAQTPSDNVAIGMNDEGRIIFPLATKEVASWEAGTHYIYNVTINSAPGLDPIKFGMPSVANFVTVTVARP